VTPANLLAPGQKRNPDYDGHLTASTKLGYAITDDFDLGFSGASPTPPQKQPATIFLTGFSGSQRAVNTTNGYYTRATAHLVLFDGMLDQTVGFGFTHNHSNNLDPLNGLSDFAGQRAKLDYQGNIALGEGEVLVIGADHGRESAAIPFKRRHHHRCGPGGAAIQPGQFQQRGECALRFQ